MIQIFYPFANVANCAIRVSQFATIKWQNIETQSIISQRRVGYRVHGTSTPKFKTIYFWVNKSKCGRRSRKDKPHSGRLENLKSWKRIYDIVTNSCRVKLSDIVAHVGHVMREMLGMKKAISTMGGALAHSGSQWINTSKCHVALLYSFQELSHCDRVKCWRSRQLNSRAFNCRSSAVPNKLCWSSSSIFRFSN